MEDKGKSCKRSVDGGDRRDRSASEDSNTNNEQRTSEDEKSDPRSPRRGFRTERIERNVRSLRRHLRVLRRQRWSGRPWRGQGRRLQEVRGRGGLQVVALQHPALRVREG